MAKEKNEEHKVLDIIPTLVIGCGGNGQAVLKQLRASFVEEFNNYGADFENMPIELLAIDTIGQERKGKQLPDEDYFKLGPLQMDKEIRYVEQGREPFLKSWMDTKLYAGLLSMGAMQVRMVGRLALFIKLPEVINILEKKISSVLNLSNTKGVKTDKFFFRFNSDKEIQIHIVGGIAGGTGAGIMIDLAYLLKNMIQRSIVTYGHFIMPETIMDAQIKDSLNANAYSFLTELDNFNVEPSLYYDYSPITQYILSKQDDIDFKISFFDELNNENINDVSPPFTFCFLMSSHSHNALLRDKDRLLDVIAEKIFLGTIDEVGDRSMERTVNIYSNFLGGFYKIKGGEKRCAYSSYGISVLKVEKEAFYHHIKNQIIKSLSLKNILLTIKDMQIIKCQDENSIESIFIKKLKDIKSAFNFHICHNINALYPESSDGFQEQLDYSKIETCWLKACADDKEKFISEKVYDQILNKLISEKEKCIPIKEIVETGMPEPINPLDEGFDDTIDKLPLQTPEKIKKYIQFKREKNFQTLLIDTVINDLSRKTRDRKSKIKKDIEGISNSMTWDSQAKRLNDRFDSLLFDNFNFDKISRKLKIGGSKTQEDIADDVQKLIWSILYKGFDQTTFKEQFNELLNEKILGYWENIMLYLQDQGESSPDSLNEKNSNLLTVNNFLTTMYDAEDEYMKIEIINSFIENATPAWNFAAHFNDHIKTIATIGCKENNYIYKKIKNLKSIGAVTPEATGEEDDPYEVPLVIEQHGLPFLGYFKFEEYRDSFYMLKNKQKQGRKSYSRPFFLDKRWEDGDILFDPSSSKLYSSSLYEIEELFALCLVFKLIERQKQMFTLKLPKETTTPELNDMKLHPVNDKEGVADALKTFYDLIINDSKLENPKLQKFIRKIINECKQAKDTLDIDKDNDLFDLVTQGISDAPECDQKVFKKMECYIKYFRSNHGQWLSQRLEESRTGRIEPGMLKELKKFN